MPLLPVTQFSPLACFGPRPFPSLPSSPLAFPVTSLQARHSAAGPPATRLYSAQMALYSASQLAFLLTGPARVWVTPPPPSPAASWPSSSEGFPGTTTTSRAAASARDGLCPESWKHILNYDRFDFTLCWIEILVPVIPLALLLLSGSIEAWSLRKLPAKRLSGFRGLGLYRLKLVGGKSHPHPSCQC